MTKVIIPIFLVSLLGCNFLNRDTTYGKRYNPTRLEMGVPIIYLIVDDYRKYLWAHEFDCSKLSIPLLRIEFVSESLDPSARLQKLKYKKDEDFQKELDLTLSAEKKLNTKKQQKYKKGIIDDF